LFKTRRGVPKSYHPSKKFLDRKKKTSADEKPRGGGQEKRGGGKASVGKPFRVDELKRETCLSFLTEKEEAMEGETTYTLTRPAPVGRRRKGPLGEAALVSKKG